MKKLIILGLVLICGACSSILPTETTVEGSGAVMNQDSTANRGTTFVTSGG